MKTIQLYKDNKGNLWYCDEFDKENQQYKVTEVIEDSGNYTYTHNSWYMNKEEFEVCVKVVAKQ